MAIQDTDIFVVQRGEQAYKMPATQLNDYVDTGGGEPGPSTDTLTDVCNRGSSPATCNRNMYVNGTLTSNSTVQGGYIFSTGNVNANDALTSGTGGVASNGAIYTPWNQGNTAACAMYPQGNAHFALNSGTNGAFIIGTNGMVEHRASIKTRGLEVAVGGGSETGGTGTINCRQLFNTNGGGRPMYVNSDGWFGGVSGFKRSTTSNITPIDTTNFIAALKAVNLYSGDQSVDESVRQFQVDTSAGSRREIGLFVEDVQSSTASNILTYTENNEVEFNERYYAHFLFGVCKEQQTLIENLTARVAALEADHTAAMSNMGDSSY